MWPEPSGFPSGCAGRATHKMLRKTNNKHVYPSTATSKEYPPSSLFCQQPSVKARGPGSFSAHAIKFSDWLWPELRVVPFTYIYDFVVILCPLRQYSWLSLHTFLLLVPQLILGILIDLTRSLIQFNKWSSTPVIWNSFGSKKVHNTYKLMKFNSCHLEFIWFKEGK